MECRAISILLVDREPAFRIGVAEMLREDGHRVVECPDAAELPRVELQGPVDVLICAHEMPSQNGLWFADRFHAARPAARVIVLANYFPVGFADELAGRPFVRCLEKPVTYDVLHRLVHAVPAGPGAG